MYMKKWKEARVRYASASSLGFWATIPDGSQGDGKEAREQDDGRTAGVGGGRAGGDAGCASWSVGGECESGR